MPKRARNTPQALPEEATAKRDEAGAKREKAEAKRDETGAKRVEAGAKRVEAGAKRVEAGAKREKADVKRDEAEAKRAEAGAKRAEAGAKRAEALNEAEASRKAELQAFADKLDTQADKLDTQADKLDTHADKLDTHANELRQDANELRQDAEALERQLSPPPAPFAALQNPHATEGSPSSRAKQPHHEQNKVTGLCTHMPIDRGCAPVELYCGAFSTFRRVLQEDGVEAADLRAARELVIVLSKIHHGGQGEQGMNEALNTALKTYLGSRFAVGKQPHNDFWADLGITVDAGGLSTAVGLGEVKLFKGHDGDPLHQAAAFYDALTSAEPTKLRPMLLLVVLGPAFHVFGALRDVSGYVCVDSLSGAFFVEQDSDDFRSQAKLLRAVRATVAELADLLPAATAERPRAQPLFAEVANVALTDWRHFVGMGGGRTSKPRIFCAKLGDRDVVVKFVRGQYPSAAHRAMSELRAAPELIHEGESGAPGWRVVVMAFILADDVPPNWAALWAAVGRFHDDGWVHGDLRAANVVVMEGRALVIDFDWAGKVEDQPCYPMLLNDSLIGNAWHSSVSAGAAITVEHDQHALEQFAGRRPESRKRNSGPAAEASSAARPPPRPAKRLRPAV